MEILGQVVSDDRAQFAAQEILKVIRTQQIPWDQVELEGRPGTFSWQKDLQQKRINSLGPCMTLLSSDNTRYHHYTLDQKVWEQIKSTLTSLGIRRATSHVERYEYQEKCLEINPETKEQTCFTKTRHHNTHVYTGPLAYLDYRLALSQETPIPYDPTVHWYKTRTKFRTSFHVNERWRIDCTWIQESQRGEIEVELVKPQDLETQGPQVLTELLGYMHVLSNMIQVTTMKQ